MVGTRVLSIKNMELKSKTDKRIIIEGQVNGNTLYLLVDTGASVGLIDYNHISWCEWRHDGLALLSISEYWR